MTFRHFVASDEWPDDDILALLDRALDLKGGSAPRSLAGRVLSPLPTESHTWPPADHSDSRNGT